LKRFDAIQQCDGQTDRRTDKRTDKHLNDGKTREALPAVARKKLLATVIIIIVGIVIITTSSLTLFSTYRVGQNIALFLYAL